MALVTLRRSPSPGAASSDSSVGEDFKSDNDGTNNHCLNQSFFMVKGAALFLQRGGSTTSAEGPDATACRSQAGDLPQHLQLIFKTLRSQDHIKMVVQLESGWSESIRYMTLVSTRGHQDMEENAILGMDFADKHSCSVGMVLPLLSDTDIHLDGDGSFSVKTGGRSQVFKPVSVQAMWCALQAVHKACEVSRRYSYFPGGPSHAWTAFYESNVSSKCDDWNAATNPETDHPDSPVAFQDQPSEREPMESVIKAKLRDIIVFRDLENITSKEIRHELERDTSSNLKEFKELIDKETLVILGQMDKATPIFDHIYLGSEWNASNLEELRDCGVGYVLNMSGEIDNFFPDTFSYYNVRVDDEDAGHLLDHWNDTYNFIVKARKNGSKCLVHCKMGASRSASTVMAYAMKEYGWSLEKAYNFVKHRRNIPQLNAGFMRQLAEYRDILDASKHHDNTLWRPSTDEEVSDDLPASSRCDKEEAWGVCGASPCRGLEMEPLDSLNYNYYFRRLSDSALDSEPSTPVRGPPLLGMERVFIEIEDVERDALLEDEGFPVAHLALPGGGGGTGAQTCGRLDPLEDMRLRLEFSTLEEEDEEEAKKEEAEMAALEGKKHAEESRLGLANLNTNNSNRLAAKRSCPAAFDDSASTGNPLKVKPSYQSCKDCCLRLPQGRRCDRPAGTRSHRLNPSRHCNLPSICIDPPDNFMISQSIPDPSLPVSVQYCYTVPLSRQKLSSPTYARNTPETEYMDEPEVEEPSASQADLDIAQIE
nr:protein phosphatase Slingshot homolog 1-like [Nerophis lumbriciformis]